MGVAHSYCDITLVIHVLYMTVYVCMCGEWGGWYFVSSGNETL